MPPPPPPPPNFSNVVLRNSFNSPGVRKSNRVCKYEETCEVVAMRMLQRQQAWGCQTFRIDCMRTVCAAETVFIAVVEPIATQEGKPFSFANARIELFRLSLPTSTTTAAGTVDVYANDIALGIGKRLGSKHAEIVRKRERAVATGTSVSQNGSEARSQLDFDLFMLRHLLSEMAIKLLLSVGVTGAHELQTSDALDNFKLACFSSCPLDVMDGGSLVGDVGTFHPETAIPYSYWSLSPSSYRTFVVEPTTKASGPPFRGRVLDRLRNNASTRMLVHAYNGIHMSKAVGDFSFSQAGTLGPSSVEMLPMSSMSDAGVLAPSALDAIRSMMGNADTAVVESSELPKNWKECSQKLSNLFRGLTGDIFRVLSNENEPTTDGTALPMAVGLLGLSSVQRGQPRFTGVVVRQEFDWEKSVFEMRYFVVTPRSWLEEDWGLMCHVDATYETLEAMCANIWRGERMTWTVFAPKLPLAIRPIAMKAFDKGCGVHARRQELSKLVADMEAIMEIYESLGSDDAVFMAGPCQFPDSMPRHPTNCTLGDDAARTAYIAYEAVKRAAKLAPPKTTIVAFTKVEPLTCNLSEEPATLSGRGGRLKSRALGLDEKVRARAKTLQEFFTWPPNDRNPDGTPKLLLFGDRLREHAKLHLFGSNQRTQPTFKGVERDRFVNVVKRPSATDPSEPVAGEAGPSDPAAGGAGPSKRAAGGAGPSKRAAAASPSAVVAKQRRTRVEASEKSAAPTTSESISS